MLKMKRGMETLEQLCKDFAVWESVAADIIYI